MRNVFYYLSALLLLVGCSKQSGLKDSDPALFREYITGFSAGTISADGPIEVVLTEAPDEDKIKDIDPSQLFEFSEKVEGSVVFLRAWSTIRSMALSSTWTNFLR